MIPARAAAKSAALRGRTVIVDIFAAVSARRKSRLYCAMPPRPPNASVANARTVATAGRSPVTGLTLRSPTHLRDEKAPQAKAIGQQSAGGIGDGVLDHPL